MQSTALLLLAAGALAGCRASCCGAPLPGASNPAPSSPARQVLFESALVTGSAAEVAAFLGSAAPTAGQSWRVVSDTQAPRLETLAAAPAGARQLVLPSVVSTSGEEATIEIRDEPPGGVWSGVRAHGSAQVMPDGSGVVLDYATLHRPSAPGSGVTPAEQRTAVAGATLRAGEVLILVSPPDAQGRQSAALVRTIVLPAR